MAAVFSGFAPYVPVRHVRGTGTQIKTRLKIASIMTGEAVTSAFPKCPNVGTSLTATSKSNIVAS